MSLPVRKRIVTAGGPVYLVTADVAGRPSWHYVRVEKRKLPLFEKALLSNGIELADYGEILASGWGESPPASVTREIRGRYA